MPAHSSYLEGNYFSKASIITNDLMTSYSLQMLSKPSINSSHLLSVNFARQITDREYKWLEKEGTKPNTHAFAPEG